MFPKNKLGLLVVFFLLIASWGILGYAPVFSSSGTPGSSPEETIYYTFKNPCGSTVQYKFVVAEQAYWDTDGGDGEPFLNVQDQVGEGFVSACLSTSIPVPKKPTGQSWQVYVSALACLNQNTWNVRADQNAVITLPYSVFLFEACTGLGNNWAATTIQYQ